MHSRMLLAGLLAMIAATPAFADKKDRLFDFTDAYYRANGVDPTKIAGRRQAGDGRGVLDNKPPSKNQRNVRAIWTQPAYNHSGDLEFFTTMGGLAGNGFLNNAAGRKARQIAESFPEFVFPKFNATSPTALGQDRQAVVLEMRHGYFSKNPLGLWLHVWVNYTDDALDTEWGQEVLAELAEENGIGADGLPIIRTIDEIEDLEEMGLVTLTTLPDTDARRYAICPVMKDPTDGGIARDAFLTDARDADGDPAEPWLRANFLSLQRTGDWADDD